MIPPSNHLTRARARELIASWTGKNVVVLGDLMLDRYLWGDVARISPEAPVPVVDVARESLRLGGAANVANNIATLGARAILVGVVGNDAAGERLREELAAAGLDAGHLVADPTRPTTSKTRVVARSHHIVRFDRESRVEIGEDTSGRLLDLAGEVLENAGALVISDYGKGTVTRGFLERLLAAAREAKVPVCVDPKDTHFNSYRGVAVVTPNQHEAAEVLGYKLRDEGAVARAGLDILTRLGSDAVLITRGAEGMSLFEAPDASRTDFPAVARRVFDVTGAGDTVISTYAAALAGGAVPREAAVLSNRAAGQVVQEVGTAAPEAAALVSDPEDRR